MYYVKCDECKKVMKETNDVRQSYAGGVCKECREEINKQIMNRTSKKYATQENERGQL